VDQLRIGSHGQFAVEAMSLAKPVVCYIQPELVPLYPSDLPLINANPDTLYAVLEYWLQRPRERHELGLASRAYAECWHDARVVAARLLSAYQQLPRSRGIRMRPRHFAPLSTT
jgi:glycosyltransferase involved in cell wall biosynthesis